jgi:hypothetical protein
MMSRFFWRVAAMNGLVGLLILSSQVWIWLKQGKWAPLPVTAVLYGLGIPEPHPVQPLIGLQKIIDWTISTLLELPASLAFVLLALLFIEAASRAERLEFEKSRSKRD